MEAAAIPFLSLVASLTASPSPPIILPNILIGQKCSATLSGFPSACTVSNLNWTASGETIQSDSWLVSLDDSSATFPGPFGPYSYTQATPSSTPPVWYWDDTGGPKTVSCTATVTPPTGQGAAFNVTATKSVTLDEPNFTHTEPVGVVELNEFHYPNPGVLYLSAGNGNDFAPKNEQANGITFNDTVLTPMMPYGGGGSWYHLQLASLSRFITPVATIAKPNPQPIAGRGNAVKGALDAPIKNPPTFKYDQTLPANGVDSDRDNDSPSTNVLDIYGEYNISNESFQDYVMYTPPVASTPPPANLPGSNSIDVPLEYFTWGWNVDVKIPATPLPKSWTNWKDAPTGGTITPPSTVTRQLLYPIWPSRTDLTFPNPP